MPFSTLRLEVAAGLGELTLTRADAANTVNLRLAEELEAAVGALAANPDVRAVLVRGEGRIFCGGGDLKSFAKEPDLPAHLEAVTRHLHAALLAMSGLEAPIVAAVQGSAAGAGLGLVGAVDLVVAAESASFVMAYTKLGLTPDGSSSWYLTRGLGLRRALELTLTNRVLSAAEAHAWGLVNRVVPDGDLEKEARALAEQLAMGPTGAYGRAKRLLAAAETNNLADQLALETTTLCESARSPDATEGLAAFLEKRRPSFRSRGQG
jgi:2-(1,2-epoxy-1,2-dihydrophenyl)acetyl-CoA isomerase